MSNPVIFKTFRTYKHPYVYDRHTTSLVMLSEDEYLELSQVEKGVLSHEQSPVIKKYQQFGLFVPNVVEKIEHSGTEIIEHYLKTRMKQLTLQVTQQCNLRCAYCAYSGIYDRNRTHANQRMSFETAKKAIDFFLQNNSELSEVVIGFYGGEPLLEFDLIRQCVEYARSKVEGKKIIFNMTTNGTLLNDRVVDYLVENDFILGVSLDGSKEEHDVNRKFVNGTGSFDVIIDNLRTIFRRYPIFSKHINIMTTINPHMDIGCVLEYFSTEEIFSDKSIMFNTMNEVDLSQEISYTQRHYRVRNYEYIKMLFSLIGKLDRSQISPLYERTRAGIERRQQRLRERMELFSVEHHGGPCMPGVRRLFVRVDGVLFPCERVSEALDYFKIGTLEDGLDVNRIRRILNIGKLTENECKNCWNLRQCMLCSGQIDFDIEPTSATKLKECPKNIDKAMFDLYELCVLKEFGFDTFNAEEVRMG